MPDSHPFRKVIVIGLDGLEPSIVDRMLARDELPNLGRLRAAGGYARIATTYPAQTPVAWSTFATGLNPGAHGIFDFLRRDPSTYLPDLALNRYEQKNPFLPPRAVNLRRGTPVWALLSEAGTPSIVLRCPCTYPPDPFTGRMLAGLGVPDIRGGLGTTTFYTSGEVGACEEGETVVRVRLEGGTVRTSIIGPRNPRTRTDCELPMTIESRPSSRRVAIQTDGHRAIEVEEGCWSEWLRVRFRLGMLQTVRGMVRFHLVRQEPVFELFATPVNFDPDTPLFPVSAPAEYASELAARLGPYYTAGMPEEHRGLNNGRLDEEAFLAQCDEIMRERAGMMEYELQRFDRGLFFCLFDTPDRLQHMFWRFGEANHPANGAHVWRDFTSVIDDHYRACDRVVGAALEHADDRTLTIALSDHGMGSFQRGINLNTWLHENGWLVFRPGVAPGPDAGDLLRHVDWDRTRAYALGLAGIYLNLRAREANGIVAPGEAGPLKREIAGRLAAVRDPARGGLAVRSVVAREEIYSGPCVDDAPDLVVNCAAGYRASWATGLGGAPRACFEDNVKRWGGDHIVDPALVPGVLFMNRPFASSNPRLLDMAPTILDALGVPKGAALEGESLL